MNKKSIGSVPHAWALDTEDICNRLDVDPASGLSSGEAGRRLKEYGKNRLESIEHESILAILVRQFTSLIMVVLFSAVVLSFLFRKWTDGIAILLALIINAVIGFVTELRALRTMESLQQMDTKYAKVTRGGSSAGIDSRRLVPGDVVLLESGDLAAADMRILESNNLTVDESALSGESVPVLKSTGPVSREAALPERKSMLFKGTSITEGSGAAVVVSTGMNTEIGEVSSMVREAESKEDPLDRQLDRLAGRLVRLIVAVAVIAAAAGIVAGKELLLMIETAIALFIAAVPEGLPIVSTVALARGMERMARRNALVRRLSAVQTLGSTTVIFTDKTGTLTENRMSVKKLCTSGRTVTVRQDQQDRSSQFYDLQKQQPIDPQSDPVLHALLLTGVYCTNASLGDNENIGDAMEIALLEAGRKSGIEREQVLKENPELREVSFDPEVKMMATFHRAETDIIEAVKGAPSEVLKACTHIRYDDSLEILDAEKKDQWLKHASGMASKGMRLIACAQRTPGNENVVPYENLQFLGLVGLLDPPRREVIGPIETCKKAGVRVTMVTGDQRETAIATGKEIGLVENERRVFHGSDLKQPRELDDRRRRELLDGEIFCRVGPKQKLDLITLHQNKGDIVAMTGDGVNDAPALKKADIGVAMGKRGQPVAEDSADIILQDDRFATIAMAIRQGRVIFENIRSFVVYMLSGNIGEICIVFLASLAGAPLPLLPLQILYINIVNDIFPAIALAVGPGSGTEMDYPPRPPFEAIITGRHWREITVFGLIIAAPVLAVFALLLIVGNMDHPTATTISFLSIAFGRLWHVFNMRKRGSSLWKNRVTGNPAVLSALGICIGLLFAAVYIGPIARTLDVVQLSLVQWGLVAGTSFIPLLAGQLGIRLGLSR
ncbi:MAG: HAD-IC family P-type ATPase [Chitinivibrionales bacterium]|nr:HAD-IC family P-type ATPase [Chitinivibrionales bacterium]